MERSEKGCMKDSDKTVIHNKLIDVFQNSKISQLDAFQITIGLFINFSHQHKMDSEKFNIFLDGLKEVYKDWEIHKEKNA